MTSLTITARETAVVYESEFPGEALDPRWLGEAYEIDSAARKIGRTGYAAYKRAVTAALAGIRRSAAARALRAIPSEARSEQSRANGRRGGRPVLMILVDDLGRSVGYCEAAGSRAGEIVEYGSRILARTRPDGYIEPQTFRVEGRATLRRTRPADREDIRYNSREWDVQ